MRELAGERLDRRDEPEIVQHRRAQLQRHPPHALERLGGQHPEVRHRALERLRIRRALSYPLPHQQRGERLGRLVVQLPGDPQALLLLGLDDLGGERAESGAVLVKLIEHRVQRLAQRLDLRVAERVALGPCPQAPLANLRDRPRDAVERPERQLQHEPVDGDAQERADRREHERQLQRRARRLVADGVCRDVRPDDGAEDHDAGVADHHLGKDRQRRDRREETADEPAPASQPGRLARRVREGCAILCRGGRARGRVGDGRSQRNASSADVDVLIVLPGRGIIPVWHGKESAGRPVALHRTGGSSAARPAILRGRGSEGEQFGRARSGGGSRGSEVGPDNISA